MEKALPNGMLPSHFGVLSHLSRVQSGTTPAALANAFQVARPSMTNTIQKLTQQGYVLVTPNPEDGRGKRVSITKKGLAAFLDAVNAIGPLYSDIIEALGEQPFVDALPHLEKIKQYMDSNR